MQEISAKPRECLAVNHAALEALAQRFRAVLLGYFRKRVSNPVEAEDLVQEVFLRMLRRGEIDALADPRAYPSSYRTTPYENSGSAEYFASASLSGSPRSFKNSFR